MKKYVQLRDETRRQTRDKLGPLLPSFCRTPPGRFASLAAAALPSYENRINRITPRNKQLRATICRQRRVRRLCLLGSPKFCRAASVESRLSATLFKPMPRHPRATEARAALTRSTGVRQPAAHAITLARARSRRSSAGTLSCPMGTVRFHCAPDPGVVRLPPCPPFVRDWPFIIFRSHCAQPRESHYILYNYIL